MRLPSRLFCLSCMLCWGLAVTATVAEAADCSSIIAHYRAVAKSDADTGNVNASVYAQMEREIGIAEIACNNGRDAEARALIAGSKSRHGYPGGL